MLKLKGVNEIDVEYLGYKKLDLNTLILAEPLPESEVLAKQSQALATAIEKRPAAKQDLIKASLRQARMTLTSPIDGTVQQVAVTTIGQVVTPGQPLLVVVPSAGPIDVQAQVENKDIGFVEVGQEAIIKIDAFPFTRYGTLTGKVTPSMTAERSTTRSSSSGS